MKISVIFTYCNKTKTKTDARKGESPKNDSTKRLHQMGHEEENSKFCKRGIEMRV